MRDPRCEQLSAILAALTDKIESVAGARNVVADEPLLDSKQDFLDTICVQNSEDETEVVYLKIDFLGFQDSDTDGCEDNPVSFLSYNLHAFQQYRDVRGDGSTGLKDIKALLLNLRNRFRETDNNARLLLSGCELQPLTQKTFIVLNNDPLTGAYGHFFDLIAKIEVL